jgi:thioredoxin-related protein
MTKMRGKSRLLNLAKALAKALCILAWLLPPTAPMAAEHAAALQLAADFAADAREARALNAPVMVLFSQSWCPWCERVRREYLSPMQRDPAYRSRVLIREVDADAGTALVDFSGAATTQREYASRFKVSRVPVIVLLGPDGALLTEPMVGMALPDFYQAYLDEAIDNGRRKLGAR